MGGGPYLRSLSTAWVLATLLVPPTTFLVVDVLSLLTLHLLHPTLQSGGPAGMDHIWTVLFSGFWLGSVAGMSQEIRGRLERKVGHVFILMASTS